MVIYYIFIQILYIKYEFKDQIDTNKIMVIYILINIKTERLEFNQYFTFSSSLPPDTWIHAVLVDV